MIRRKFIPEKASELLVSMCDGLEFALNSPGLYRINMGTFGEPIGEDDICMGCLATYTILERARFKTLPPHIVFMFVYARDKNRIWDAADALGMSYEDSKLATIEFIVDKIRIGELRPLCEHYKIPLGFREQLEPPFPRVDSRVHNIPPDRGAPPTMRFAVEDNVKNIKWFMKEYRERIIPELISAGY